MAVSNGILQSAISGLSLNAQRVAAAADNIANVSTDSYKRTDIRAKTVTTAQPTSTAYAAGGVLSVPRQMNAVQGLLAASTRSTDFAISGKGYFPVSRTPSGGETLYTRDGSFAADASGNLVNTSGLYLQAYAPGSDKLSAVNVNAIAGTAKATSTIDVGANLPATASAGTIFPINAQATDSLGNAVDIRLNFTAQTGGAYQVDVASITELSTGATTAVARSGSSTGPAFAHTVTFGGDGLPTSTPAPVLNISGLSSGAADLNIQLKLGQAGQADGLTKYGSQFSLGRVNADGAAYGQVSGVSVNSSGTLSATFDNGTTRTIAEVRVATFTNPNGLSAVSGNAFRQTGASSQPVLRTGGSGGAGTVQGGARELSNTDLGTSFVNLIVARSAYSASLKVLETGAFLSRSLLDIRS